MGNTPAPEVSTPQPNPEAKYADNSHVSPDVAQEGVEPQKPKLVPAMSWHGQNQDQNRPAKLGAVQTRDLEEYELAKKKAPQNPSEDFSIDESPLNGEEKGDNTSIMGSGTIVDTQAGSGNDLKKKVHRSQERSSTLTNGAQEKVLQPTEHQRKLARIKTSLQSSTQQWLINRPPANSKIVC